MNVNGFVHNSFQEACDALGLLKDDRQWDVAISENAVHAMPRQLRRRITNNNEMHLNQSDIQNFCLAEIEKLFNDVGKSLKDYNSMPFPNDSFMHGLDKRLLSDELCYNKEHEHDEHDKLYKSLNKEKLHVYASIIDSVENGKGVLPVASSGIAATLLPGGRTAHSRFHIPLKFDEYSVAGIKHAPIQHRHVAESVDRSLRDIMTSVDPERASLPFGGITIVFGGDFRQILPVIPKASRAQVVSASLNSSKIWDHCRVFLLEKNMRLSYGKTEQEKYEIAEFSRWVLYVGNGTLPNVHPDDIISDPEVVIPDKFLIRARENPLKVVVDVVYPDLAKNIKNADYLRERSILTPTNSIVGDINSYILDQVPGKEHSYFSQDSLVDSEGDNNDFGFAFPIKYLNSINMPCLPKHHLKIKEGCVIMLMRNLNQIMGLCNGTRMIVKRCLPNSIVCDILIGSQVGTTHIIPRIEMEPSDTQWLFEFKRVQFPVQLCYAMTINKSHGQSLH
ncbi:uncharacterized protein LOC141680634 [Apium graveolens]|uniref:uncharacterized protein LOC141680634 n=1 Tax=Apium graveolens TaxID=4045 RepID=UPI003D7A7A2E